MPQPPSRVLLSPASLGLWLAALAAWIALAGLGGAATFAQPASSPPSGAAESGASLAGEYHTENGFTLTLEAADQGYRGTLRMGPTRGVVQLMGQGQGYVGTLRYGDDPTMVMFRSHGEKWFLTDGQFTLAFQRAGASSDDGEAGGQVASGPAASPGFPGAAPPPAEEAQERDASERSPWQMPGGPSVQIPGDRAEAPGSWEGPGAERPGVESPGAESPAAEGPGGWEGPGLPGQTPRGPRIPGPGEGPTREAEPGRGADVPEGWVRFTHASGGSFAHPRGWRVVEQQGARAIVPAALKMGREFLATMAGPSEGMKKSTDPRVGQYIDSVIRGINPSMRRRGATQTMRTSVGEGAVYAYRGTNPLNGAETSAEFYVVVMPDYTVSFVLVGETKLVDARRGTMERIFTSFERRAPAAAPQGPGMPPQGPGMPPQGQQRFPQPQAPARGIDRNLLGAWYGEAVHHSSGVIANSRFTYHFSPDGTILAGAQGAVNVSLRDGMGRHTRGSASGGSGNVMAGRWTTSNGVLAIDWQDGSRRVTHYRVRGRTLEFRTPQGKLIDFMER